MKIRPVTSATDQSAESHLCFNLSVDPGGSLYQYLANIGRIMGTTEEGNINDPTLPRRASTLVTQRITRLPLQFHLITRLTRDIFQFSAFPYVMMMMAISLLILTFLEQPSTLFMLVVYLSILVILLVAVFSLLETSFLLWRLLSAFYFYYFLGWNLVLLISTLAQELNIAQTAAYGFVAETAALHFYQQKQVARHLFTFLWILSISLSDALPHFSRRVKLGSIALCVAHVVQMWLQTRLGVSNGEALALRWCASAGSGSCISANALRFSAMVNICIFFIRQIFILSISLQHSDFQDPNFMIIMARLRVSELLVNDTIHAIDTITAPSHVLRALSTYRTSIGNEALPRDIPDHPRQLIRRRSCVPLVFGTSVADTIISQPHKSTTTTTSNTPEIANINMHSIAITSDFDVEYPDPTFLFSPLWGQTLLLVFLNSSTLQVSAVLSGLTAISIISVGVSSTSTCIMFFVFALYSIFWMSVAFDRNLLRLLVQHFEFAYGLGLLVVFYVSVVLQTISCAAAQASFRNVSSDVQFFASLCSDLCWAFVSAMTIGFDAHRGTRRYKLVVLFFMCLFDMFLIYRNLLVFPGQLVDGRPWLAPPQLCLFPGDCFDTQAIRVQCYATLAVFTFKYLLAFWQQSDITLILRCRASYSPIETTEFSAAHSDVQHVMGVPSSVAAVDDTRLVINGEDRNAELYN